MYVYIRSGDCFTVGFYDPKGTWIPESDWGNPEDARRRVHYLNGGNNVPQAFTQFEKAADAVFSCWASGVLYQDGLAANAVTAWTSAKQNLQLKY